jgi:ribosomal protein L12E/L44/L45/RPP1/RPP2
VYVVISANNKKMKLTKVKDTYNDYRLELSWGQLEALISSLESNHADPILDEMLQELKWYLNNVPKPGESEEEFKENTEEPEQKPESENTEEKYPEEEEEEEPDFNIPGRLGGKSSAPKTPSIPRKPVDINRKLKVVQPPNEFSAEESPNSFLEPPPEE